MVSTSGTTEMDSVRARQAAVEKKLEELEQQQHELRQELQRLPVGEPAWTAVQQEKAAMQQRMAALEQERVELVRQAASQPATQQGLPDAFQVNCSALCNAGCESLLAAKLLITLEDGTRHQVTGMFVMDTGCRGIDLDLVLTRHKAHDLGLKPFAGPGGQAVVVQASAANKTPMPLTKMWPQVIMLVPLHKGGRPSEVAALRKSNLTVWAADVDAITDGRRGGSEGGVAPVVCMENEEEQWGDVVLSDGSSSSGIEAAVAAADEYDGEGYQALHSPIHEHKHIALLGISGLAKLGLKCDFARKYVYSVWMSATIASVRSI